MSQQDDLKALTDEWYAKLKKSGFKDIEDTTNGKLKSWHSRYFKSRFTVDQFEAKVTYYREAGKLVHTYKFADNVEKKIWRYHAEGKDMVEIQKLLKDSHTDVNIWKIRTVIAKLRKSMEDALSGRNNDR